jgi:Protein of unknown function (DUF1549)/Protein of unknown function (DUF1553)/Planctomycete cytochrome C
VLPGKGLAINYGYGDEGEERMNALVSRFVRSVIPIGSVTLMLMSVVAAHAAPPAPHKAAPPDPEAVWYNRILPLLDKFCLKCHAGVRQRGGLDLRSLDTVLRGGDSGPAIVPGQPLKSRIIEYVQPGAADHMPPDTRKQLSASEIADLKGWIASLPQSTHPLPTNAGTDKSWTQAYLADYKQAVRSKDVLPSSLTGSKAIDWFLQKSWQRAGVTPSALCDDAAYIRRASLDIIGRIPTHEETAKYFSEPAATRRSSLVDTLLQSPEYARHMRELFDPILMGRASPEKARERTDRGWYAFLENAFGSDAPWNETVRQMIVARPAQGAARGAVTFLLERGDNYQAMAEAVAPVTFGVQVSCAQCHNHPLSWEIEQRHYWGLVSVFNRSKSVNADTGQGLAESAIGGFINFTNLKKESQPALLVFLNGKSVPEKVPGPNEKEMDRPELYLVPPVKEGARPHEPSVPRFSRREQFALAATTDNPMLARAMANRIWAAMLGRGIVNPVDEIDSRHRPSHPELLEWLTARFMEGGYRLKPLIREIALSRVYQLDTKPAGKVTPLPESFARGLDKPLTAEQLIRSIGVCLVNKPEALITPELTAEFASAFPDVMPVNYNPTLNQALFLSNSPAVNGLLKPSPGSLLEQMLKQPGQAGAVKTAFVGVLGRAPDAAELQQCSTMLKGDKPEQSAKNLVWALMTSAEFMLNH